MPKILAYDNTVLVGDHLRIVDRYLEFGSLIVLENTKNGAQVSLIQPWEYSVLLGEELGDLVQSLGYDTYEDRGCYAPVDWDENVGIAERALEEEEEEFRQEFFAALREKYGIDVSAQLDWDEVRAAIDRRWHEEFLITQAWLNKELLWEAVEQDMLYVEEEDLVETPFGWPGLEYLIFIPRKELHLWR